MSDDWKIKKVDKLMLIRQKDEKNRTDAVCIGGDYPTLESRTLRNLTFTIYVRTDGKYLIHLTWTPDNDPDGPKRIKRETIRAKTVILC